MPPQPWEVPKPREPWPYAGPPPVPHHQNPAFAEQRAAAREQDFQVEMHWHNVYKARAKRAAQQQAAKEAQEKADAEAQQAAAEEAEAEAKAKAEAEAKAKAKAAAVVEALAKRARWEHQPLSVLKTGKTTKPLALERDKSPPKLKERLAELARQQGRASGSAGSGQQGRASGSAGSGSSD